MRVLGIKDFARAPVLQLLRCVAARRRLGHLDMKLVRGHASVPLLCLTLLESRKNNVLRHALTASLIAFRVPLSLLVTAGSSLCHGLWCDAKLSQELEGLAGDFVFLAR